MGVLQVYLFPTKSIPISVYQNSSPSHFQRKSVLHSGVSSCTVITIIFEQDDPMVTVSF